MKTQIKIIIAALLINSSGYSQSASSTNPGIAETPSGKFTFMDVRWKTKFNTIFVFHDKHKGEMIKGGETKEFKWTKKGQFVVIEGNPIYFFKFDKKGSAFGVRANLINQEISPE